MKMLATGDVRRLLAHEDWLVLWQQREQVDWAYVASHVPLEIQWHMVVAASVAEAKCWEHGFLYNLPEDVLHTFACDCVSWFLDCEDERGLGPNTVIREMLDTKYRWLQGVLPDHDLYALIESSQRPDHWEDVESFVSMRLLCRALQLDATLAAVETIGSLVAILRDFEDDDAVEKARQGAFWGGWPQKHLATLLMQAS